MDGFTYTNIFETKGFEYLIIIAFLALLVPFWFFLNRKGKMTKQIQKAFGVLSRDILKIPQGIFYSPNHTWVHLGKCGAAEVGLDDLLLHLIGDVKLIKLKNQGDAINKGELMAEIAQKGKVLRIFSPLSGKIVTTNPFILESPGIMNDDPYGKGWIYQIKPNNWAEETNSYYLAEDATKWTGWELNRIKDFLAVSIQKYAPGTSGISLQEGGEICDHALKELQNEVWQDFQKEFLNPIQ
ncbi:MAG: glycine cleavage system protein H [Bacteroidia bacterium]|nr:glycine cleavage system protein H [Bacteroidia bacterium]